MIFLESYPLYIVVPYRILHMNTDKKYTTIQVRKEINEHIREFCKKHGIVASTVTENYWTKLISGSLSGSILF
jgi:hypothetical protein